MDPRELNLEAFFNLAHSVHRRTGTALGRPGIPVALL